MSILIKGMEMPRSCFYCQFQHKNTTECLITHEYYNWGLTTPPSDCPLIELPPHGRLIDADALRLLYDFNGYKPTGDMTKEEFDRLMCRLPVIRQNIDDMPTIIEADDSIKHGKWMPYKTKRTHKNWWQCSLCGFVSEHKVNHNFCPWCGAKMTIIESEDEDDQ